MKLASFEVGGPTGPSRRVGVVIEEATTSLVDVTVGTEALRREEGVASPGRLARATAPPSMQRFLEAGDRAFDAAAAVLERVREDGGESLPTEGRLVYDLEEVRLLSPLPKPHSLRDFMLFEEHVKNSLGEDIPEVWYELPVYYKGSRSAIAHPGEDVEWPEYTDKLDYELELAAVIGKRGRDIDAADAESYIAGYTVFNDFSARDIQMREMEAKLGPAKGKDFANGLGPYLATPDEVDLGSATMRATVNGEEWSKGTPGTMRHSFAEVIEHVSRAETLHPGDVLGSGTVGKGCGLELDRWLSPGDEVSLSVEGIGTLTHRVVREGR